MPSFVLYVNFAPASVNVVIIFRKQKKDVRKSREILIPNPFSFGSSISWFPCDSDGLLVLM